MSSNISYLHLPIHEMWKIEPEKLDRIIAAIDCTKFGQTIGHTTRTTQDTLRDKIDMYGVPERRQNSMIHKLAPFRFMSSLNGNRYITPLVVAGHPESPFSLAVATVCGTPGEANDFEYKAAMFQKLSQIHDLTPTEVLMVLLGVDYVMRNYWRQTQIVVLVNNYHDQVVDVYRQETRELDHSSKINHNSPYCTHVGRVIEAKTKKLPGIQEILESFAPTMFQDVCTKTPLKAKEPEAEKADATPEAVEEALKKKMKVVKAALEPTTDIVTAGPGNNYVQIDTNTRGETGEVAF